MRRFATTHDLNVVTDELARLRAHDARLHELLHGAQATESRIAIAEMQAESARRWFDRSKKETDPSRKQHCLDCANAVLRGEVVR